MWTLECDGDLFQHKKTWLKPGHQYLFGRTKVDTGPGERSYAITHKTVSRKHLIISVSPLKPGQGSEIYTKSTVTITDESKLGTYLDGTRLIKESKILSGNEHSITLGSYEQQFRLTWKPVVITIQVADKQLRNNADPLAPHRTRFEQFDIKIIQSYIIGDTTYVVSSKRNTAKCLQALINGKHIVTEGFLDALEMAASSPGPADDGTTPLPSQLEQDIDGSWPNAMEYLPGPAKEPIPRPAELFAPDPKRLSMFDGYTFVFADQTQFDSLQSIVTNGGAKALKFDIQLGQTTLQEFVKFVRSVADKKGLGNFGDNSTGKGVVVVRFRGRGDMEDWVRGFIQDVDRELEQRSIEQNEFLDAIVMADASVLRKPLLEEETEGISAPPSTAVTQQPPPSRLARQGAINAVEDETTHPRDQLKPPTSAAKLRARRQITQSRFKGFDDFDVSQIDKIRQRSPESPIHEEEEESQTLQHESRSQSNHGQMDIDSQSLFVNDSQPQSQRQGPTSPPSRKRRAPVLDNEENDAGKANDDMLDALLPAAAAMKKRRLEDEAAGRTTSFREASVDVITGSTSKTSSKKLVVKKELDVRAVARSHAEALDAQRDDQQRQSQGENGDHEMLDDGDIAGMRDLAIIEEMVVPERPSRGRLGQTGDGAEDERWDDRWNGRRNFKKFKKALPGQRQSQNDDAINNRARKVIVPIEEVKRKDYGIGDDYWLESSSTTKPSNKKRKDGTTQTQSQSQTHTQTHQRHTDQQLDQTLDDDGEFIPEAIAGQPREGPVAQALREINGDHIDSASTTTTTPATTKTSTTTRGKRTAPATSPKEAPPPKRMRQGRLGAAAAARAAEEEDDSSDDELKFRFRRKR